MSAPKPRRPYGTGSVIQLADGRWRGKYPVNGKECYVYARTKAECNRKLLAAIKAAKEAKKKPVVVLFRDYANDWLEKGKRHGYKAKSYEQTRAALTNYLIAAFGDLPVGAIKPEQVRHWVDELAEYLAPATVERYYKIFHCIVGDAVKDGTIESSPCVGITLPKVKRAKQTVLSMRDLHLVLDQLRGSSIHAIVAMAATMGMRKGELLALRWSAIDFINNVVHVRTNVERVKGRFAEDDPKTRASIRSLPLMPFVAEILKAWRAKQNKVRLLAGEVWEDNDLVFPNATGGFRFARGLDVPFKNALKRAKLPEMRFHDLRHTCASLYAAMGVHPKVVQELMGHASITETLDRYSWLFPSAHGDAAKKMNQEFLATDQPEEEVN